MNTFLNILGYIAAAALVWAYFCITTGRWKNTSLAYQGTNFFATALLIIYGVYKTAWANVLLNTFWIAVAVIGLYAWNRKRRQKSEQ